MIQCQSESVFLEICQIIILIVLNIMELEQNMLLAHKTNVAKLICSMFPTKSGAQRTNGQCNTDYIPW